MARPLQITDDTIIEALTARPEVTSADLADAVGIGQSTAGKRLVALEAAGAVRRAPGGRDGGRRVPDRWSAVTPSPTAEAVVAEQAAPEPVVAVVEAAPEDVESEAAGAEATRTEQPAVGNRLGRGALGSLVRDYLAARPEETFGPAAVGKALGRSQGAISNSLATMGARGEVVLVGDKPRRYRIASAK
jgi:DNA-binding transcriptional ArsR family regulator